MFRRAIATLVIGVLTGCAGTVATPAPTANPTAAPTANPTTAPTPEPTEAATPEPSPEASLPSEGLVEPGRYSGEFDGYRFAVTVPDEGWTWTYDFQAFHQGDDAIFWPGGDMTSLYARACDSAGTEFEVGPTVDDLVEALVSLEDFEVSEPVDVTLDGHEGKRVVVTVPADVDVANPDCDGGAYSLSPARSYQAAGQADDMWILDVDGQRLVPTVSVTPAAPADVVEQLEDMLESLGIELT